MKPSHLLLFSFFIYCSISSSAQTEYTLQLKNENIHVQANIRKALVDSFNLKALRFQQKTFAIIQFETLPAEATKKLLSTNGVELLEYIPNNAYTVSISGSPSAEVLEHSKARTIFLPSPEQKMDARLVSGNFPSSAVKVSGTVDVWISFARTFSPHDVVNNLTQLNFDILSTQYQHYRIISIRVAASRLKELAGLPFVEYVQAAPGDDQPLNFNSRSASTANILSSSIANGGRGLNGEGVTLGIGDNADVQTHIDFAGRLINRSAQALNAAHGYHTAGTLAGAGIVNEFWRGYAPKANIISQSFSGILLNAQAYVSDYGMVATNNSYGDNIDCGYMGTYDLYSRLLDQMAFDLPELTNVFAAGNSGTSSCTPFSPGYHTVLGGYQSAKNVITVGATTDTGYLAAFSSRGPVKDGRVKPEITAMGQGVGSAGPSNSYFYSNGTSMAAPAVTGGLALLYQRYRQLNNGSNPKNGLMKAILCNGAFDKGNAGPDFQYGFGWMNLLRSVEMLELQHYFIANCTNNSTNTNTISVPANTAQLKVMLYWNDPAASPLSAKTLVNDLDLEVTNASLSTTLPVILDTANNNLPNPALSGTDHTNNIEQVVINNPVAGNYLFKVKGTSITQNPSQEYFLVYDIVPVQLKIVSPVGGEGLAPSTAAGDRVKIGWEAYGYSGTVTLEFSSDGGANWSTIATGVDVNRMLYSWFVPNIATSNALIKITKEGTGETSISNAFTIIGQPTVSLDAVQCEGYINVNWNPIIGATDYEVMTLQGDEMKTTAVTDATSYTLSGLSKDSTYWVTVRARINGSPGRRAIVISRQPNNGSCTGTISDNDLKIDAIIAPTSGRKFTSTQLGSSTAITVRVKNLDDAPVSNFDLKYSINGSAFVTENVTATIAAGGTYTYTFSTTADLSTPGTYNLLAVVKNSALDNVSSNDTAVAVIRHADNQPLNLTTYFIDNVETALPSVYENDTTALVGADRYDFLRTSIYGRLRTFVNSGIAYSGSKAFTLDVNRYYSPGNTNYLTGTYNLTNYNANTNDIRLDFQYNNHGQLSHTNNKVWIRGNDMQPWIEAYDLDDNQNDPGIYKKSTSIKVADLLMANGQTFSPSFQVRWGQWGFVAATDKENANGYSFDDIRLYEVFHDMQMLSIDSPIQSSCGLTNNSTITVKIRNSSNALINNVPVRYRINNGTWITETIPSVPANDTLQYNFITGADLSASSTFTIQAIVDLPSDNFHENDTTMATVVNSPIIASFPYLQNFELGNGNWYSGGKNASWQYGTPVSTKINRAASGAKAWKTRLQGNYNDQEQSYLYSPCFDLTGLTNPTLSFSVALDLEDCGLQLCDGTWIEYSADGITWNKLGAYGQGTNWYNKSSNQLWSIQDFTRWHVATISLPTGLTRLRLRFVLSSDPAVNREGIAIDDVHVYDNNNGIYDGVTMTNAVSQTVSGSKWIHFISGGKLIASIHPNNQNLGNTNVQAYINAGTSRYTSSQYYMDRNITIKPANTPVDSVRVRFYYLDKEADSLINAKGCSSCSKPASAYELGVSKYSDPDTSFENGSINDNQQGIWTFIDQANVAIVPFDKGYYAEFRVKDFSEFWLNNGGIDKISSLPVKLLDFIAVKRNNDVVLTWITGSETNVARYEIEFARGEAELQAGHFIKIGETTVTGNTPTSRTYTFIDKEADKFGYRYYRLKTVNTDGSVSYSPVRTVKFEDAVLWKVYPNPSKGLFSLVYQLNTDEEVYARVIDTKGSVIKEYRRKANGILQKLNIELFDKPVGVYLLEINASGQKQVFKLYKR